MHFIGIDVGTSGTKTVLFNEAGAAIAEHTAEYEMYQPRNGWAEQHPADWWAAVCEGLRSVLSQSGLRGEDVAGLGLSGQMHGLVMLDDEGEVLRPSIIWCDQRTQKQCDEITERVGAERLIRITANPALTGFTAGKILWVRENEPEVYARCRHILLPKDYIRYKLTGEFATEVSDASGMQLLDVPARRWSDEVLDALSIDCALLGQVYESQEVTGKVHAGAAEQTGLAVGTVVAGGAGDNAAAAVGTGIVRQGQAFTTIGTSGVVYAHTDSPVIDTLGRVHTFCCAVPGAWHVMGVTQAAGLSLKWFRDHFCQAEKEVAGLLQTGVYRLMDQEAEAVPIGSDRLFFVPYLMGERTPHKDANARGVFFGLSAVHGKAHLLRAVLEGVAFSLADCMDVLREMQVPVEAMVVTGGGSVSPLWRKMLADLFGLPLRTIRGEGAALGAGLLAAVATGIFSSLPEACSAVIQYGQTQAPDPASTERYRRLHALYRRLYPALKESFAELAALE